MLRALAIIVLSFCLLILQSTFAHLFPWDMFIPSLTLPVILYMGLHEYDLGIGAILSFIVGYLMDVFAGSPMGLYTFVAVAIFLFSRVAALRLFLQGWIFEIVLTFLLAVLSSALILAVRALFDTDFDSLLIYIKIVTFRAAATALAAPIVFRLIAKIELWTPHRKGGEGRTIKS